jgi:hypothetical protein
MNSIDTLTKRFLEAGFDEHQAEALASALREAATLATQSVRSGVPTNVDFAAKSKRVEVATIINGIEAANDLYSGCRAAGLINVAALLALMQILSTVLLGRNLFEELVK